MRKTAVLLTLASLAFISPATAQDAPQDGAPQDSAAQDRGESGSTFLTRPWTRDLVVTAAFGGEVGRSGLSEAFGFTIYDEQASIATAQRYGSGVLVDLSVGYHLGRQGWLRNLLVGGTLTYVTGDASSSLAGDIPSPIFTGRPRPLEGRSRSLGHSETAFHLSAIRMFVVRDDLDVGVFLGPSVFRVSHEFVGAVGPDDLDEAGPPRFETVSLRAVPRHSDSGTAFGGHVGANATYRLPWTLKGLSELGVTTVVRYATAAASLDGAGGRQGVDAGGLQVGGGVRLTFDRPWR